MWLLDRLFRRKVIIAIHGLANKPPKRVLRRWWQQSIHEGLAQVDRKKRSFNFHFVYWADLMYEQPLDPAEIDEKSEYFLDNPYSPGDPSVYEKFTPSRLRQKILDKVEKGLDRIFFEEKSFINYNAIADKLVRTLFKDLDYYYHRECSVTRFRGLVAKEAIRDRLARALKRHRHKKIMLIAHSMGTIIAYDVLTRTVPKVPVHTMITIGSPLGLPIVIRQIQQEQGKTPSAKEQVPTPENVTARWFNFSDLGDPVAINYSLADDFGKNSRGIGPEDTVIFNNYEKNGKRDAHNSYGYCRAPEVARAVRNFLRD
ncbi:MAG: hypothetical protein JXA20_00375 [Spirochaetes bacterium]|nr:hypothetical protein [Spirochaetota bacterium]